MILEYVEVVKSFPHTDGSPIGNEFWVLLSNDGVEAVTFRCPCGCGCGRECYTPVTDATKGQPKTDRHWLFSRGPDGRPTLSPSIRYTGGCKAHFNITELKTVMHGDSGR